jgi:hypothetical protein
LTQKLNVLKLSLIDPKTKLNFLKLSLTNTRERKKFSYTLKPLALAKALGVWGVSPTIKKYKPREGSQGRERPLP